MADKDIFVISDLHIGDHSSRDWFSRSGKDQLLWRFLGYVADQGGRLVIAGDLFELWRFSIDRIQEQWEGLLDRLLAMQAVYIPGNHDADVAALAGQACHPFLGTVQGPFVEFIGDRRFWFMHGHEVDPFDSEWIRGIGRGIGSVSALFDLKHLFCRWTDHRISDVLYGLCEQILHAWSWMAGRPVQGDTLLPEHEVSKRPIRTQRMLARFDQHRQASVYDVAVAGHTHKAGSLDAWYFNSGCWTKPANNFLRIRPDGYTEVCDWDLAGARLNPTRM